VRIVAETGKTVAKELGGNETTLADGVSRACRAGTASAGASDKLERVRRENTSPQRCLVLWVK
jgi:hypothetical protein